MIELLEIGQTESEKNVTRLFQCQRVHYDLTDLIFTFLEREKGRHNYEG